MRMLLFEALVVTCVALLCPVDSNLTFRGSPCGDHTCGVNEYCSDTNRQCESCLSICDKALHNFDEQTCVEQCQGYLHDIRYVRSGQNTDGRTAPGNQPFNNSKDINKLYTLVIAALVLIILLILANAAYAGYKIHQWAKKNNIKANNILSYFKGENNNEDVEKGSPNGLSTASTASARRDPKDLHLNIANTVTGSEQPPTPATMTTSISRRPAEDSALDYAYDNRAMAGTPSPQSGKTPRESNF